MRPPMSGAVSAERRLALSLSAAERGEYRSSTQDGVASRVVGVVGAPGVGKSTLINRLVHEARHQDETVVVLAVDPSSAITGGALLGDRIRLRDHSSDSGVFVRSFATRGHPGGLAASMPAAIAASIDAGWDRVVVEAVGGGQADIGLAGLVNTLLLVVGPDAGDEIQVMKAGVLEHAHLVVVNEAEHNDSHRLIAALQRAWRPPDGGGIVRVCAETGAGVPELFRSITEREGSVAAATTLSDPVIERILWMLNSRVRARLDTDSSLAARIRAAAAADGDASGLELILAELARSQP